MKLVVNLEIPTIDIKSSSKEIIHTCHALHHLDCSLDSYNVVSTRIQSRRRNPQSCALLPSSSRGSGAHAENANDELRLQGRYG